MGRFSKLCTIVLLLQSACIVDDEPLRIPDQSARQQPVQPGKRSNKKMVGSKQPDPSSLKVEISIFESVQPNPVLAKMSKGRGNEATEKVCRWSKVDSNMKQFTQSVFPGECADIVHIAWHPEIEGRSLVSIGRDLYRVSGAEATPLPEVEGRPYDVGVTPNETYLVRTAESKVATVEKNGQRGVEIGSEFIAADVGESASIYRSYQYDGNEWLLTETTVADAANRPERTPVWEGIGHTTTSMHPGVHGANVRDATPEEQKALTAAEPDGRSLDGLGGWQIAETEQGDIAWRLSGPKTNQPSLPLMHRKRENWSTIQTIRYKIGEGVTLHFRDGYLLVTRVGTRPYVYDLSSGKMAYKSVTASGVLFWPHFDSRKDQSEQTPNTVDGEETPEPTDALTSP